jgi:hypothetical protein
MTLNELSDAARLNVAHEACFLLNLASRELGSPVKVFEYSRGVVNENMSLSSVRDFMAIICGITGLRYIAFQSVVLAVFRLREIRMHLVAGWLFTEDELKNFGFLPLEDFIGGERMWRAFEIVRHQLMGHSIAHKSTKTKPGRMISGTALGKAIRQAGLQSWEGFADRVSKELVPGVLRTRDELAKRYPSARNYINCFQLEYEFYADWPSNS